MRQERPVVGKRDGPPQPLQASPLLPRNLREHRRPGEVRAIWPGPLHHGRPGILHQELRGDLGVVRMVHVPPALAPDRGQLLPPPQLPGEQHLQRLSEAGLPAAVAADDHGQPRAGLQAQGRGLPDPPESLP